MRQVLGDTLRRLGISEESVADILLAATEACANVVLHAESMGPYEVVAAVGRSECRVEVRDDGAGWGRPRRQPSGELAESGRGFALMRACVDGVTLRTAPGQGTSVVLDKRIRWDEPVPVPA